MTHDMPGDLRSASLTVRELQVQRVIQLVKPDTVMVELDEERARSLTVSFTPSSRTVSPSAAPPAASLQCRVCAGSCRCCLLESSRKLNQRARTLAKSPALYQNTSLPSRPPQAPRDPNENHSVLAEVLKAFGCGCVSPIQVNALVVLYLVTPIFSRPADWLVTLPAQPAQPTRGRSAPGDLTQKILGASMKGVREMIEQPLHSYSGARHTWRWIVRA